MLRIYKDLYQEAELGCRREAVRDLDFSDTH